MRVRFTRGNQDSIGYKQQTLEEGGSNCSRNTCIRSTQTPRVSEEKRSEVGLDLLIRTLLPVLRS